MPVIRNSHPASRLALSSCERCGNPYAEYCHAAMARLCLRCATPFLDRRPPDDDAIQRAFDPPSPGGEPEGTLRFVSVAELRATTPPDPPWVWRGYVARGAVTLLAGKPKAGKSTLVCALIEAVDAEAGTFLGRAIHGGAIVLVSEEGSGTLRHKLVGDRLRVLTREAAWPRPTWTNLLAAAVQEARRVDAVMLVVDSLAFFAAFGEGAENDASVAQQVMAALAPATAAGLAVVVVHHQRKSGGHDGDAVRGSGAIFGSVDALVEVERPGDAGQGLPASPPGHRQLIATGRWAATPPALVVDRDVNGTWRVVGEAGGREEAGELGARERVLSSLPTETPGATEPEVAEVVGVDVRKIGRPLRDLVDDGLVTRLGGGRKGDPYTYSRAPQKAPPNAPPTAGEHPGKNAPPYPTGGEHLKPAPPLSLVGENPPADFTVIDAVDDVAKRLDGDEGDLEPDATLDGLISREGVGPLLQAFDAVEVEPSFWHWNADEDGRLRRIVPGPGPDCADAGSRGGGGRWLTVSEDAKHRDLFARGYRSVQEVADLLDVTPAKVHALRRLGKLKAIFDDPKSMYMVGEVDRYLDRPSTFTPPPPTTMVADCLNPTRHAEHHRPHPRTRRPVCGVCHPVPS